MKNENQKEIDMIVGEIISHSIADDADHLGLTLCEEAFEKLATSILTKLQKDEIGIFEGKWIGYSGQLSKYLNKNIILTVKVDKDE